MDTHELAWAAGFFDGEGCVSGGLKLGGSKGTSNYKARPYITLHCGQTDRYPLERFDAAVQHLGRFYGPYNHKGKKTYHRPWWQYSASTFEKVQAIVAMLWPFLSEPKREQVGHVLLQYKKDWTTDAATRRIPPDAARAIRIAYAAREASLQELAVKYGVSKSSVHSLVTGKTHKRNWTFPPPSV